MQAKAYQVFGFSEPLRRVEITQGEPKGTEILIRTRAAGLCHSDLHIWECGYDLGRGQRPRLADRGIDCP
jgi:propanol-preferring alcohol dehydrogenase